MPVAAPQRSSTSMEKAENHENESEAHHVDIISAEEVNAEEGEAQHVHAKTLVLLAVRTPVRTS